MIEEKITRLNDRLLAKWRDLLMSPVCLKVAVLFAAALVVRALFAFAAGGPKAANDTFAYLGHANALLNDGDYGPANQAPGYPVAITLLLTTVGHYPESVLVYQVVLSAMMTCLIYITGRELFNESIGLLAGLYSIIYYPFIDYTRYLLTETQFTFLVVATAAILAWRGWHSARWQHFAGGLALGLTSLTRSTALMYLPFVVVLGLTRLGPAAGTTPKERLKLLAFLFAGWAIVIGPWTARNYIRDGVPVLVSSDGGFVLYLSTMESYVVRYDWDDAPARAAQIAGHDDVRSPEAAGPLVQWVVSKYLADPIPLLRLRALAFSYFWWPVEHEFYVFDVNVGPHMPYRWLIYGLLLPWFLFGTYKIVRHGKAGTFYLLAVILGTSTLHTLTHFEARYRLPIAPMLMIIAMYGAVVWFRGWQARAASGGLANKDT